MVMLDVAALQRMEPADSHSAFGDEMVSTASHNECEGISTISWHGC
ncbi:SapB/AmfS family lanthipeptide [Nocardia brasiliensis]|nr:SapB/AmfS family lanthipeptide [Nocardia brasiliensis]